MTSRATIRRRTSTRACEAGITLSERLRLYKEFLRIYKVDAIGDYFERIYDGPVENRRLNCTNPNNDICSITTGTQLVRVLTLTLTYEHLKQLLFPFSALFRSVAGPVQHLAGGAMRNRALQVHEYHGMSEEYQALLHERQVQRGEDRQHARKGKLQPVFVAYKSLLSYVIHFRMS